MGLTQNQTISQKLIITNEMKQSLAFLQMPIAELTETIKKELDENPVLEEDFSESESIIAEKMPETDFDRNDAVFEDEKQSPFDYVSKKRTLKDFLYEQLCYIREYKKTKALMAYMIENIDRRGYLGCDINDISKEMNVPAETVLHCLKILQDFQPDGVFARDIKECLTIQLRKKNIGILNVYVIVENYLPLLSENKIKTIALKLGVGLSEASEYCGIIKGLEPKPSRGFAEEEEHAYIIPEAIIQKSGSDIQVLMNDYHVPRLKISGNYKKMYSDNTHDEAQRYVKERLNAALFLIKSIEQRKATIYNILTAIVAEQKDYFHKGCQFLKPMTINKIAGEIGCHESTVSRAIRHKYVQAPHGLLSIKDFFTSGCGADGQEISSAVIKNRILTIIRNENKSFPLSDQQIVNLLANNGIYLSRRTIAKYREEMGVASSVKRKEF